MVQRLLTLLLITIFCDQVHAQPGKDGDYTVLSANTVVNKYSQITDSVTVGSTVITVRDIATDLGGLTAGDLIMIYQAQRATLLTTDDNTCGTVSSFNNSGLYEYAYIASTSGNTITIDCCTKNAYTAAGHAQVIKIPQYSNLTIPSGTSIVAAKWNGVTGGIVSVHVNGTLANDGTLSAESAGFLGGKRDNLSSSTGASLVKKATYGRPYKKRRPAHKWKSYRKIGKISG